MTGHAPGDENKVTGPGGLPPGAAASMTNGTLKAALWVELAKQPSICEAARERHPALRRHATVLSVLGALSTERGDDLPEKEALTRAVLEEHQSSRRRDAPPRVASFWATLLLAAFYPMLAKLRFSITPDAVEREDLDQLVIEAFLTTASSLRLEGRRLLMLRLKSRTRRAVFAHVRGQRRDRRGLAELVDAAAEPTCETSTAIARSSPVTEVDEASLVGLLALHAGRSIEQAQLDLVVATLVRGERLTTIVDREHPGLPPLERARMYERIKRRHSRTLSRLQKLLRGADFSCPDSLHAGLLRSTQSDAEEATA